MNSPWTTVPSTPGTQLYGYPPSEYLPHHNLSSKKWDRQINIITFNTQPDVPAYHPVQVRQAFDTSVHFNSMPPQNPSLPAPATNLAAARKKIDWPQPVRSYVQRSFHASNLVSDVTRPEMEAKLKETITTATDNNALMTIDWDNLPLPQHMIRSERAQVAWQQESLNLRLGNAMTKRDANSRKRKSQDVTNDDDAAPPWHIANHPNGLEDRITYSKNSNEKGTCKSQKTVEKRQRRFDGGAGKSYKVSPSPEPCSGPVVGTCQTLEKRYFRLTSAPIPSQVRPEPILRKTLDLLKKKWKKEGNYSYICDQFKSMRQDLTVQRITNDFTATVYEIHARIALEKGDLGEYNQCQTQLRALYAQNLGGSPVEFKAYRILYFIHTSNRTALNDILANLTKAEKEEAAIKHALGVRSALALGNYHRFFRLYLETPNMGAYLMDMFVVRERLAALSNICKAYKPEIRLRFITEELGFESDRDAAQFICDYSGQHLLIEKDDGLRVLTGKAGLIFESAKVEAFRKVDIKGQI